MFETHGTGTKKPSGKAQSKKKTAPKKKSVAKAKKKK